MTYLEWFEAFFLNADLVSFFQSLKSAREAFNRDYQVIVGDINVKNQEIVLLEGHLQYRQLKEEKEIKFTDNFKDEDGEWKTGTGNRNEWLLDFDAIIRRYKNQRLGKQGEEVVSQRLRFNKRLSADLKKATNQSAIFSVLTRIERQAGQKGSMSTKSIVNTASKWARTLKSKIAYVIKLDDSKEKDLAGHERQIDEKIQERDQQCADLVRLTDKVKLQVYRAYKTYKSNSEAQSFWLGYGQSGRDRAYDAVQNILNAKPEDVFAVFQQKILASHGYLIRQHSFVMKVMEETLKTGGFLSVLFKGSHVNGGHVNGSIKNYADQIKLTNQHKAAMIALKTDDIQWEPKKEPAFDSNHKPTDLVPSASVGLYGRRVLLDRIKDTFGSVGSRRVYSQICGG